MEFYCKDTKKVRTFTIVGKNDIECTRDLTCTAGYEYDEELEMFFFETEEAFEEMVEWFVQEMRWYKEDGYSEFFGDYADKDNYDTTEMWVDGEFVISDEI